jgi:hypothetical protein
MSIPFSVSTMPNTPFLRFRVEHLAKITNPSETEVKRLQTARSALHTAIVAWINEILKAFPGLKPYLRPIDNDKPETTILPLPNAFNAHTRSALSMDDAAKIEYTLRTGQAHDALDDIRYFILSFNHSTNIKIREVHSQFGSTRAQHHLQVLYEDMRLAAKRYRRVREALLRLGMSNTDPVLQSLSDNQLWAKNSSKPRALGDATTPDPWYWTIAKPAGLSSLEEAAWIKESELHCQSAVLW